MGRGRRSGERGAGRDSLSSARSRLPRAVSRWLVWAPRAALGLLLAAGLFTFDYAGGTSYLRDDPTACLNCHIMREQYAGWQRGPHRRATTCNDCHTGHGVAAKYASKAVNGFNHSLAFTTGRFSEPLQINDFNRRIAEANCRRCHGALVQAVDGLALHSEAGACLRCHADMGH